MPALILPLTFTAIFLALFSCGNRGVRSTFVEAVILLSLAAVLITESLSAVRRIELEPVLSSWMIVLLAAVAIAFHRADVLKANMRSAYLDAASWIGKSNGLRKWTVFSIMGLTLLLLIQGLVYPSNSTDTLMYHLPRVVVWIGQRSVEHFPSGNFSQVCMPPFAEYLVMNVNILNGGDRFCNTVEWFFLTACAVAASQLTDLLLARRGYGTAAHLLVVCLPVAVLQSSTANNDIVASFFLLTSVFYSHIWLKEKQLKEGFWLGASFGLACLTKATAYLYLGPIAVWLAADALLRTFREGTRPLMSSLLPVIIFTSILANLYVRNLDLTGNLLCIERFVIETGVNNDFSIRTTFTNLFKNLGGQMGPYPLNALYDSVLYKVHQALDIPIKIKGTHFFDMDYRGAPNLPIHDSTAPNSLHTGLLLAAFAWMFLRRTFWKERIPAPLVRHATLLIVQLLLFSAFLKWQPWHTRLLMPLYCLSIPIVCHVLNRQRPSMVWKTTGLCMVFGTALFAAVFNDARPVLSTRFTQDLSIGDGRFDKFFTDRYRPLSGEMRIIKDIMDSERMDEIGLIIDSRFPEYILFHDAYKRKRRPLHLDVRNVSGKLEKTGTRVDCIVTNTFSDPAIVRDGRTYWNSTPEHSRIWLYR